MFFECGVPVVKVRFKTTALAVNMAPDLSCLRSAFFAARLGAQSTAVTAKALNVLDLKEFVGSNVFIRSKCLGWELSVFTFRKFNQVSEHLTSPSTSLLSACVLLPLKAPILLRT